MTSPSQPSGFAAYFAAQPISTAPLIHGLTSPPRTDSPSDSKLESVKASVSESPATIGGYGAATPVPTPPTHPGVVAAVPRKALDISDYTKRAWKLIHDPELHAKGSTGRSRPKEIRQSGHGVTTVSDPRKYELNYGSNSSKGKKKLSLNWQKLQFQFDANSVGPPPPAQIVVWGLSPLVTPEQVQTHFRPFGEIQELDYKVDPSSGAALGVCRIKYKINTKDLMSGHVSAKKAVSEAGKIRLGGSFVQVDFDKDGLKTIRRMGEAVKKRLAEQAAQVAAREAATAVKDTSPMAPKPIPTGPASDRREKSPPFMPSLKPATPPPPPPPPPQQFIAPDQLRLNSGSRRSIDSRTPLTESSRSRRTSPSPTRGRQKSISDTKYRTRSPEPRFYPRDRSRSKDRSHPLSTDQSRQREHSRSRDRSQRGDDYGYRPRSRSRSLGRNRDSRHDPRRYSPRRRSTSRDRDDYHRRRRRSPSPHYHRIPDDRPGSPLDKYSHSSSGIGEYRPSYSTHFRPNMDDINSTRKRDITPPSSSRRRHTPQSDRDEERGRPRKRSPISRTRSSSDSPSSIDQRRSANHHGRGRRRTPSSDSISRSPHPVPLLSSFMSHKLHGRPYIFINDCDLPVDRFSSRDLGLCFKKFHPSVYDDNHGFYIAFCSNQDARDCFVAHGDGKSFIDGCRLRMQLIDDKSYIRASKSHASPPRRKPLPKKSLEDESAEIILAELKEVFIKDVRSRIVNPMILDFLDPSHYKDIHPKTESETPKTVGPDVKISPVKPETVPPESSPITSRIPSLPRFRKKAVEPLKRGTSVGDRKPTKADVRPMHHQFNHYSDSEDEDERPQREASVISDDEDESSRPSRETTTVSTPEPSRVKGKTLVKIRDTVKEDIESEEELLKDVLATTTDGIQAKRKRVVDFTSSEDEDEPSPSKKVCVETEAPQISDAMEIDEPKLSKAAIQKMAKAKAAALRRAKKAEVIVKEIQDSIAIENVPVKEVKAQVPTKPKIPEVDLMEIEDDENTLLDLDGVQTVVRDREDFRYLLEALVDVIPESIQDIWTWSWKQKKLKALNFDGARGPMKKPESPAYNRINSTGSARTEGYIKIPEAEKSLYLPQRNRAIVPIGSEAARKTSRMNRVNNRRLAADMEVQKKTLSTESDILRFNQLKARKKQLKFARSPIHDWGLFAMEDIEAHEMVIEYVGEIVRFQVAELREKQYERVGIGSSYLFRVDDENIIDATKTGNIARFINHCCTPNCSAKIIQVQGEKKIVIYADRFIAAGEEITYDYKFPREDVKIPCFCGSAHCKGTLN